METTTPVVGPFASKWGGDKAPVLTPMPQMSIAPKMDSSVQNQQPQPFSIRKYAVPIMIVVGTLAAIALIAIIILVIRNRNSKKSASSNLKFIPGADPETTKTLQKVPEDSKPVKKVTEIKQQPKPVERKQKSPSPTPSPESEIEEQLDSLVEVAQKIGIEPSPVKKVTRRKTAVSEPSKQTTKEIMEQYVNDGEDESDSNDKQEQQKRPVAGKKSNIPPVPEPLQRVSTRQAKEQDDDEPEQVTASYLKSVYKKGDDESDSSDIGVVEYDQEEEGDEEENGQSE
jgi:hypothetical protein